MKSMLFNLRLFIFMVLAGGVLACSPQQPSPTTPADTPATASTSSPKVVYVNADTLLSRYESFRIQMDSLAAKERRVSADLNRKGQSLQQQYVAVQQQVQQGLLAPNQIAREEQRLGEAQQKLLEEREQLQQQLLLETEQVNLAMRTRLDEVLKALMQKNGYDYILQYSRSSELLMANEALDITDLVLAELNKEQQ